MKENELLKVLVCADSITQTEFSYHK